MNLDLAKYANNPHVLTALLMSSVAASLKKEGRDDLVAHVSGAALGKPGTLVISTSSSLASAELKLLSTPILDSVTRTLSKFEKSVELTRLSFRVWNAS